MSFDLLSEPVRRYIRDKGWQELRPIQNAAIKKIVATEKHYILASGTASGKTEAAFLPILSKVDFNEAGVQVLYISPLIALINDQFSRVEDLCRNLEVVVTRWHGEANRSFKEKLVKDPSGIVLITPESIEAMFVNKPYNVKHLFSGLKFVVIDEIHSFIGSDRGAQLKSLLSRLQEINRKSFRVIGLSATIGDYEEAKKFTGYELDTVVLLDRARRNINAVFKYFKGDGATLPLPLLKDLYKEVCGSKVLIFPNSRGRAEEIAVSLKRISERVHGHPNYFSHHSSIHKEVREYVEYFAKNNNRSNFCIACTSTLELGIDIGNVDEVVQIDATHNIASLIQRVGRSGRREGAESNLFLYATDRWSLLQSLACWLLYMEEYIEPPVVCKKPYDLLLHQALSITKEHSGIIISELVLKLRNNSAFKDIEEHEITEIIEHLISTNMLEKLRQEIIIGIEGEKIVNDRDFYSSFTSEVTFKVVNNGNVIGEIPYSPQVIEDQNILLAAKIWKITGIDFKAKRIEVVTAKDGTAPLFSGGGGVVDKQIRQKMLDILLTDCEYAFLDESSAAELSEMRKDFSVFDIKDVSAGRPLLRSKKQLQFFTFTGTKINRTLELLFDLSGMDMTVQDHSSCFITSLTADEFVSKISGISVSEDDIDNYLSEMLLKGSLPDSKWGGFLPQRYQVLLMRQKYYDFDNTAVFLKQTSPVVNLNDDDTM